MLLNSSTDKKLKQVNDEAHVNYDVVNIEPSEIKALGSLEAVDGLELAVDADADYNEQQLGSANAANNSSSSSYNKQKLSRTRDSYQAYIQSIKSYQHLDAVEEKELFIRYRNHKDLSAARQLVTAHLMLVVKIAQGYSGYGLPQMDLIQEGNIALMKAVQKFDLTYTTRLSTFATYLIKSEIHEFIIRNWKIVKIATTKAQRKLFFGLRKHVAKLLASGQTKSITDEAIAQEFDVPKHDVKVMRARMTQPDLSIDAYQDELSTSNRMGKSNEAAMLEISTAHDDQIQAEGSMERTYHAQCLVALRAAIDSLNERSKSIIAARHLQDKPATLQDLASKLGISAERVRQLETQAIDKIKKHMQQEHGIEDFALTA